MNSESITRKAATTPASTVVASLPQEGQNADKLGNVALVVQVLNGLDMLLAFAGIVPPGTIPIVVNGIVAIGAGVTQWWAKRKTVKVAYFTPPSSHA